MSEFQRETLESVNIKITALNHPMSKLEISLWEILFSFSCRYIKVSSHVFPFPGCCTVRLSTEWSRPYSIHECWLYAYLRNMLYLLVRGSDTERGIDDSHDGFGSEALSLSLSLSRTLTWFSFCLDQCLSLSIPGGNLTVLWLRLTPGWHIDRNGEKKCSRSPLISFM